MITEDYVSYEVAKLLKEKGFKGSFDGYYNNAGCVVDKPNVLLKEPKYQYYERVPVYMATKWLRKIYSLEIYPYHDFPKVGDKWWFEIIKYPNTVAEYESETAYNSYEDACEAAIKYCLENLI